MLPTIRIIEGMQQGMLFPLGKREITIGRDCSCTIQVNDSTISRVHCRVLRHDIVQGEPSYVIKDEGSFNGTMVNGVKVDLAELAIGDEIGLGQTKLQYFLADPVALNEHVEVDSPESTVDSMIETSRIEIELNAEHKSSYRELVGAVGEMAGERLVEAQNDLDFVYNALIMTSRKMNRRALFNDLLELILKWSQAEQGIAFLLDGGKRDFSNRLVKRLNPVLNAPASPPRYSRSLLEHVVEKRVGVLKQFRVRVDGTDGADESQTRDVSAICVPVMGSEELYGVLYLDTYGESETDGSPARFRRDQLKILVSIARQTAMALENQAFFEESITRERHAVVGELTSAISHRVNNILQVIQGGSYLVEQGLKKDNLELIRKGWKVVHGNQSRITRLTSNLLAYSRPFEPYQVVCSLKALLDDALMNLKESFDISRIDVAHDNDQDLLMVLVDSYFTSRVIENLLSVALVASRNEHRAFPVYVETSLNSGMAELTVHFDQLEERFDMNSLTDGSPPDKLKAQMGVLELAVSQHLLEAQDGQLLLVSGPDGSNRMTVQLRQHQGGMPS